MDYGAVLKGQKLKAEANEIQLQPGSTMDLTGAGYSAGQGPGAGQLVRKNNSQS